MPTPASPAPPSDVRPPLRGLALLTAAVVIAHLALLGLAPTAVGPRPSPLANKFITRTIVIAPPAVEPAAPAAAPAVAARPPPPKPAHPRPVARPPAPAPAPEGAPPPEAPGPDLTAQASAENGVAAESVPEAPAAPAPAGAASAGANGGTAAGQIEGPVAIRIPGSVRLEFDGTAQKGASPYRGYGELLWLQDGQQYDAQLTLSAAFITLRRQHSVGVIGPTGIEPARFSDKRRAEVASHFVRDKGAVVFSSNAPSVPLLPGAQDRVSVVMQLGALIAADPARYGPGGAIAVQTVGPRDADIWIFKIEGDETLALLGGQFVARKLTRNPRKPFDDKLELWLAPELGYLPVQIRQTESNGDVTDLQLRKAAPVRP